MFDLHIDLRINKFNITHCIFIVGIHDKYRDCLW